MRKLEPPESGVARSIPSENVKLERSAHRTKILTRDISLGPDSRRSFSGFMKAVVLHALFAPLALLLVGCHHEHRERVVIVERQSPPAPSSTTTTILYEERPGEVTVYREPPAPREEVVVWEGRPSPRHVWINGHWAWHGHWEWVSGHWHPIPKGRRVWIAGRWELQRSSGCYLWVGGHWE
jgi:hypothetical protein